jgi:hypothetical protein
MMSDPFKFTDEDKVAILLARVFYLAGCVHKGERPSPDMLHTGQSVFRKNAETAVGLLGFDNDAIENLVDAAERLYNEAVSKATPNHITAIA